MSTYTVPLVTLHGEAFEPRTLRVVKVAAGDGFDAAAQAMDTLTVDESNHVFAGLVHPDDCTCEACP